MQFILLQIDPLQLMAVCVKTTPQMTRFRDGKVCKNLATDELTITEYSLTTNAKSGLRKPEGKNAVLGIASAWWRCTTTRPTPMTTWPPRPEHLLHSAHEHWHVKWMCAQFSSLSCSVFVKLDCTPHCVVHVSIVRVISWSSHDERISSTLSPPFRSTSSSSQSSLTFCTSSCTSSTTLRAVATVRTSPKKRWIPLTTPTSSQFSWVFTCFRFAATLNMLLFLSLCFRVTSSIVVNVPTYSLFTCMWIPCDCSHCENESFDMCCLYTHRRLQ